MYQDSMAMMTAPHLGSIAATHFDFSRSAVYFSRKIVMKFARVRCHDGLRL